MESYNCDMEESRSQNTVELMSSLLTSEREWLWIRHPLPLDMVSRDDRHMTVFEFDVQSTTLGTMCDPFSFNQHAKLCDHEEKDLRIDFQKEAIKVILHSSYNIDISFNEIRTLLVQPNASNDVFAVYAYYDHVPKIWHEGMRTNELPKASSDTIGRCNVLRLSISGDSEQICAALSKLQTCNIQIWWASVDVTVWHPSCRTVISKLGHPNSSWAMKCLLSQGYRILDQIKPEQVHNIVRHEEALYQVLQGPVNAEMFVDFWDLFNQAVSEEMTNSNPVGLSLSTYVMVRKVIVTPTRIICLPPEHVKPNRVLREFHPENFLSVAFRDDNECKLQSMNPKSISLLVDRIKRFLHDGLQSDGRHYRFLGCSNSQLRSHGVWMFATDPTNTEHTIESIREWMGDLSRIRCTAVYVARLGQFFSSSEHVLDLAGDQYTVVFDYPDVVVNGYCFTDGVGCISPDIARKVAKTLNLGIVPSAFQIRLAGCKGVLSVNPRLEDGRVHIRPSMRKFDSGHLQLEVLDYSKPQRLCLNRQVITILSGLGVEDDVFLHLLDEQLDALGDKFTDNEIAVEELSKIEIPIDLKLMVEAGIDLIHDSFWRSLLLVRYRDSLRLLREKTQIVLPLDQGRLLMGIADETGTLKDGEVYIQYSNNLSPSDGNATVHNGDVVVTKSPCFHPGDVRKLKAVDKIELQHIVDCIVFPVVGQRPHPNEISGSDLDGDMYWVCWYRGLVPDADNVEPMDFPKHENRTLDHVPNQTDMIDYYRDYIKYDLLGLVANAHLAQADMQGNGIFSEKCHDLARINSEAVDFPKTGKRPDVDPSLRPSMYPDFMMKLDKSQYRSDKILGIIYRKCTHMCESLSENEDKLKHSVSFAQRNDQLDELIQEHKLSPDDLHQAREHYGKYSSEMHHLFSRYGIKDEASLIAGRMHLVGGTKIIKGEAYEVGKLIEAEVNRIRRQTRVVFEAGNDAECFRRAHAWYRVAYDDGRFKSFAWIGADCIAKSIQNHTRHIWEEQPVDFALNICDETIPERNRALRLLKSFIEDNGEDLRGNVHIVDTSNNFIAHDRAYIILNEDTHKRTAIMTAIMKLQETNFEVAVSTLSILRSGALFTVEHNEHEIEVEIITDYKRRGLLEELTFLENKQEYGWFWILVKWIRIHSHPSMLQNVTLLHLWDIASPFLCQNFDGSGIHSFLKHYSRLENLLELHHVCFDLWDLPMATIRRFAFLLQTSCHLVAVGGNAEILLQCKTQNVGKSYQHTQRLTHIMSTHVDNMLNQDPDMVKTMLRSRSKCLSVDISSNYVKDKTLNILEAFGSKLTLKRLREQIDRFEEAACELRDSTVYAFTRNSQIVVLEGTANDTKLSFDYQPPWNQTDKPRNHVYWAKPRLLHDTSVVSEQSFQFESWGDNLRLLADIYDEQLLGNVRMAVRFVKFRCIVKDIRIAYCSVGELLKIIRDSRPSYQGHGADQNTQSPSPKMNIAMTPVNPNLDKLKQLLKDEGLIFCGQHHTTLCKVFTRDEIGQECDFRSPAQIDVIFDGDLNVSYIRDKSTRWSAVAFVRKANMMNERDVKADISLQLQSRRIALDRSTQIYSDFADPDKPILTSSENSDDMPDLHIMEPFKKKVKYIRQKRVEKYKYRETTRDHFTAHVQVHISHIREYEINIRNGKREPLKDSSICVVHVNNLPPPGYQRDMQEITRQLWDLSRKISDIII